MSHWDAIHFGNASSRAHVIFGTLFDPAPFSSTLSISTSSSLLYPCAPQSGLLFGRFAEKSPLTGYEPNAPVEVSSTEVITLLPSSKASICSTCDSGDDIITAPAVSEVDERSDLGMLASPLSTLERQVRPHSEFITRTENVLRHVHHTFVPVRGIPWRRAQTRENRIGTQNVEREPYSEREGFLSERREARDFLQMRADQAARGERVAQSRLLRRDIKGTAKCELASKQAEVGGERRVAFEPPTAYAARKTQQREVREPLPKDAQGCS